MNIGGAINLEFDARCWKCWDEPGEKETCDECDGKGRRINDNGRELLDFLALHGAKK